MGRANDRKSRKSNRGGKLDDERSVVVEKKIKKRRNLRKRKMRKMVTPLRLQEGNNKIGAGGGGDPIGALGRVERKGKKKREFPIRGNSSFCQRERR